MKRSIQLIALSLIILAGSCTGEKKDSRTAVTEEKPKVKLAEVKARPVDQTQDYTATVEANVKNSIAPSAPVRIDKILVEVGDKVHKGQKLVIMDQANLNKMKMQLEFERLEFNRTDELYKVGGISKSRPGLGMCGPAYSWNALPDSAKWVLSFLMLVGRLELFTVLLLFTPEFWKKR